MAAGEKIVDISREALYTSVFFSWLYISILLILNIKTFCEKWHSTEAYQLSYCQHCWWSDTQLLWRTCKAGKLRHLVKRSRTQLSALSSAGDRSCCFCKGKIQNQIPSPEIFPVCRWSHVSSGMPHLSLTPRLGRWNIALAHHSEQWLLSRWQDLVFEAMPANSASLCRHD